MATWQPPIPAGALYSRAARDLGPALPLLAYCYDLVRRDGWIDLSLHQVAADMDEPYPTVKRWWQAVEAGPFFCEVQKRGRRGIRAHFRDIWIDWRIVQARDDPPDSFGIRNGPETGSEMISNDGNGIRNGPETGSEMIPQPHVYGTHDSDLADLDLPPPSQPPRAGGGGGARVQADPLLAQLGSLFSQLDITNADRLAARYRSEYPQVTLAEVAAYVARLAVDCEKDPAHRGSRYYRKLEHGIPTNNPSTPKGADHGRTDTTLAGRPASAAQAAFERDYLDQLRDTPIV